jgi:hypothetical protein
MSTQHVSRLLLFLTVSLVALSACAPDVVRHNEAGNEHFDESAYDDAVAEYRLAQVDEPDLAEPYYIRHIKPAPVTDRASSLSQPLYWAGWVMPLLAVVGTWLWDRRRHHLVHNVAYARAQRARR